MNKNGQHADQVNRGLRGARPEHANCGVGILMDLSGHKSHQIVRDSLQILKNLDHRGARGAEENTGDGAGILLQKPHTFFQALIPALGDFDSYGVGQFFFPYEEEDGTALTRLIEAVVAEEGFTLTAWRDVPTDNSDLGRTALMSEPCIRQLFVQPAQPISPQELDTRLYLLRRSIENAVTVQDPPGSDMFYICSLDRRRIVYKGLLTNAQVETYYPDLLDPRVESSLALVHARFSTNTLGSWKLAHPYRCIVHNGEINTFRGNYNWMRTREADLEHPRFGSAIDKLKPITHPSQSDTAMLDNVLELLIESGRSLPHTLRMVIPEAWNKDPVMDSAKRDWYEYHSTLMEPWDGPALVAATDGYSIGAMLDRNGFRPCRYLITRDNRLVMASEAGVLPIDPADIREKGRLKPGQMFLADAGEGRVLSDEEVFTRLTDPKYSEWLAHNRIRLSDLVAAQTEPAPAPAIADITALQCAFGYTQESLTRLIRPMAEDGKDPVGAMGDDTPPSVLSNRTRTLFTYFKQSFAQVSNPPIDYIREDLITTLESYIGRQRNLLAETPEHCRQLFLRSPILRNQELAIIQTIQAKGIRAQTLDITYAPETSLQEALAELCRQAVQAIQAGFEIVVLSDRATGPTRLPMPALLAVAGLHHHLVRQGLRTHAALILESGQPCAVHHFCTLVGYGADAINPYLAFESIKPMLNGNTDAWPAAVERYIAAVEDGMFKVMSKMGISTLDSYKGAQIFEAIGLDPDFIAEYFTGTVSQISGVGIAEIEADMRENHHLAFGERLDGNLRLAQGGDFYWRRNGEFHQWNPDTIGFLQHAGRTGDARFYQRFAQLINEQEEQLQTIRGLVEFRIDPDQRIPIEEVEPVEAIFKRFFTGAMSFGSLSKETHESLAIAMNRIGGTACSGEGGEQVERFGTERECRNKQVASGRFGVTSNYLVNAKHLEIKVAQGAKPGEGGQLPGTKVNEIIAEVRFTIPGVGLISPPPHHDIYSIEDLAQLIHDLKCANPEADIHVKLVSEAGVGTIAAGVAKARADAILIAGDSGGTGAAAKTSIKNVGTPWELGLAETNQVLLENRLRSRVRLRVDGGIKTGRDVVIAALLGAEEYGFGTSALVTLGCIMLRKCHCNTCSVGVATQDPELRKKFPGKPEYVINYMHFVAQEIRELMAELGFRTMAEMIGRVDKLRQRRVAHSRASRLDLSAMLYQPEAEDCCGNTRRQNHRLEQKRDHELIERARSAIDNGTPVEVEMPISSRDLTFGTLLSSQVAQKYGQDGLPEDTIQVNLVGTAGQSFGAFLSRGISLHLEGEANDYVGKGLSGGKLSVRIPANAGYPADCNTIIGNVALYGATGGQLYANGIAGERFAVRNSGAMAVVEGVGNHGCEYMTGGAVVVLGGIGKNFGAGMSGGEAYILAGDHEAANLEVNVNPAMVHLEPVLDPRDQALVRRLIENHYAYTGSGKAQDILENWESWISRCVKVVPEAYAQIVQRNLQQGMDIRPLPPESASVPIRDKTTAVLLEGVKQ
jgi:glutamate synthase domain-containing protein 2/glutamate synthase domain-containing protein 1/glutamate synthase domain-containing protein 3